MGERPGSNDMCHTDGLQPARANGRELWARRPEVGQRRNAAYCENNP